jgi:hypothetical protein
LTTTFRGILVIKKQLLFKERGLEKEIERKKIKKTPKELMKKSYKGLSEKLEK